MKTKVKLHKYLQQIRDALPERIRKRMTGRHDRENHLDVTLVGWFGLNFYGDPEPSSVFLCFTGINVPRTRTYQIKNGVLKTKRLIEVVIERFDKRDDFDKQYAAEQAASTRRFKAARHLEPITFPKVKPGKAFKLDVDERGDYLAGGAKLIHKDSGNETEIWAKTENTVSGAIPFGLISVEKLNEILKILGKA